MEQQIIENGGLQYVPQIAVQYVYLDFDGELTSYNGEILTVDNVEVKDSALTGERIADIVAGLNAKYALQNVIFVTEKPETAEYSTIFIGKTSAFDEYGNFAGLAETIDSGNKNKSDNAFVMLDSTFTDAEIISTISHETDHLLGTLDHGGAGLTAYAKEITIDAGITSTGLSLSYWDYSSLIVLGTANKTTVSVGTYIKISNGGVAHSTTIKTAGNMTIYSGGIAYDTTASEGEITVLQGGILQGAVLNGCDVSIDGSANDINASDTFLNFYDGEGCDITLCGGSMKVYGGVVNRTTINSGGILSAISGIINNTVINSQGVMYTRYTTTNEINNVTVNSGGYLSAAPGIINTLDLHGQCSLGEGGSANIVTVYSGGVIWNRFDRVAFLKNVIVSSGGNISGHYNFEKLTVLSGGTIKEIKPSTIFQGDIILGGECYFRGYDGSVENNGSATLTFDLRDRSPEDNFILNMSASSMDFLRVSEYFITVSTNQEHGLYKLADRNYFSGVMTIKTDQDSVEIKMDESVVMQGIKYSFVKENSALYLSVGTGEPDLLISEITFDREEFYVGEECRCYFTVINNGGSDAENFSVSFKINGVEYSSVTIESLAAKASSTFYVDIAGEDLIKGESTVTVFADSLHNVKESDESNNSLSVPFTVKDLPDLVITRCVFFPDLIGKGPSAQSTLQISFANQGKEASDPCSLAVYCGDKLITTVNVGALAVGESRSVSKNIQLFDWEDGTYYFTAKIDSEDKIKESNEFNNSLVAQIDIDLPDLVISDFSVDNVIVKNGHAMLRFEVSNQGAVGAEDSETYLYIGEGADPIVFSTPYLPPGGKYTHWRSISSFAKDPGSYKITMIADGSKQREETWETNNSASTYITIKEKTIPPSGGENKAPDLTVTFLEQQKQLKQNEAEFIFSVSNIGKEDADASVLYVFVDDSKIREINISALKADEAFSGTFSLSTATWSTGTHKLTVKADGKETISESDEDNNEKSLFFTIPDEQTPGPAAPGGYIFHYSQNTFMNYLQVETQTPTVDLQGLPAGIYQWRHKQKIATQWQTRADITSENTPDPAEILSPEANGDFDLFFAEKGDVWSNQFVVQHTGILSIWQGTGEQVLLAGKNKFSDVFFGSGDANILVLTDDDNGDALFMDDIYSAFGTQARLSKINEIRAGFGDDIIDLTSQRYAYTGEKMTVYGGLGNDTIWANADKNILYGDAGNDRIVGAWGNDFIIGGAGNDSMHGGGGEDIFCFSNDWGCDTIEQLADGKVILHFESDSGFWDESTLTYSDGTNSIQVRGVLPEDITLKFGGAAPVAGAFADAVSEKIFEDKNSGMLA